MKLERIKHERKGFFKPILNSSTESCDKNFMKQYLIKKLPDTPWIWLYLFLSKRNIMKWFANCITRQIVIYYKAPHISWFHPTIWLRIFYYQSFHIFLFIDKLKGVLSFILYYPHSYLLLYNHAEATWRLKLCVLRIFKDYSLPWNRYSKKEKKKEKSSVQFLPQLSSTRWHHI